MIFDVQKQISVWAGVGPLDRSYDCELLIHFFKSTEFQKLSWSCTFCLGVHANLEFGKCQHAKKKQQKGKRKQINKPRCHTAVESGSSVCAAYLCRDQPS